MDSQTIKLALGPGKWKRRSKTGSKTCVTRVFEDVSNGVTMCVVTNDVTDEVISAEITSVEAKNDKYYIAKYPHGAMSGFYFALSPIGQGPFEDIDCFIITPKDLWDAEKVWCDQDTACDPLSDADTQFYSLMESVYEHDYDSNAAAKNVLLSLGATENLHILG